MRGEAVTAMSYNTAEHEILPAGRHGKTTHLIVACWRVVAAFWALLSLLLTIIAVVSPPVLFALMALRGKNPLQAPLLVPLAGSLLGGVALCFGLPALRAYALFVRPTCMISLRNITAKYLASGFAFSILGAAAVFLVYRKPEEKLIYAGYLLYGIIVFSLNHAFRRKN